LIGVFLFCFLVPFAFAGPVFAQCEPVGTEFQVNTYVVNAQSSPSIAGLAGGGFVVAWDSNGQDGSGYGVYGQVFDSAGNKVGAEFRVSTFTNGDQFLSSAAGLAGGGFVVTWT
jgi:hypothetical protein